MDRHMGICDLGPADFPELAMRLFELGIDSMSLNPDRVVPTRQTVANAELRVGTHAEPVGR